MRHLLLPILVAGCSTGSAWDQLRSAVEPPPELTFSTSGPLLLTLEDITVRPQSFFATDFEGHGYQRIGYLDSHGVFWLDSSLRGCN